MVRSNTLTHKHATPAYTFVNTDGDGTFTISQQCCCVCSWIIVVPDLHSLSRFSSLIFLSLIVYVHSLSSSLSGWMIINEFNKAFNQLYQSRMMCFYFQPMTRALAHQLCSLRIVLFLNDIFIACCKFDEHVNFNGSTATTNLCRWTKWLTPTNICK